jgi:putative membrane protein
MSKLVSKLFSEADFSQISAAVKEAETRTSGEIVPYVVEQSDGYDEATWKAGFMFGFVVVTALVSIESFTTVWLPLDFAEMALISLLLGGGGMLLARFVAPVRRLLVGATVMEKRVSQRAAEAFIAEEVFDTRERTGILIFLSLLERRVLVLGDSGINAKVDQSQWDGIVQLIVSSIRERKPAEGLIAAIKKCGALLQQEGVERQADDTNEIPNYLRTGDEPNS